ncbi:Uncharacterised protein [Amycolatopsis camponoti]|uniref:Uncharacterized protein n=1 Tax=Amycolatopsis camponoti TaxID=2606593 RepID=A0A6I8LNH1_9PSEU|nr:Uncharacterised protein [Amycolatopsis camponoti]
MWTVAIGNWNTMRRTERTGEARSADGWYRPALSRVPLAVAGPGV